MEQKLADDLAQVHPDVCVSSSQWQAGIEIAYLTGFGWLSKAEWSGCRWMRIFHDPETVEMAASWDRVIVRSI
jgi:hypothetical protein